MSNRIASSAIAFSEMNYDDYHTESDESFDSEAASGSSDDECSDTELIQSTYQLRGRKVAASVPGPSITPLPHRFSTEVTFVAIVIAAVAGVYLGRTMFSENTASVKGLCDTNIALLKQQCELQLSQDHQLTDHALQALDSAFKCHPISEGVQGLVNALNVTTGPLQSLFGIFREAARNISTLVR
jgi:hypothetical protein